MNKVILIGALGADPEKRITPNNLSVCTFRIAVQRQKSKEKVTDWFNIVTWRTLADNCERFLQKGSKVCIVGQIQTRSYDDKNGAKRYVTEIIADEVEFLDSKPKEQQTTQSQQSADDLFGDELAAFEPVDDSELPF
jgi:single-strand DNA-binding protein